MVPTKMNIEAREGHQNCSLRIAFRDGIISHCEYKDYYCLYYIDRLELPLVQSTPLNNCIMTLYPCLCCRLWKKSSKSYCPILFKFRGGITAKEFITSTKTVANYGPYKYVKIFTEIYCGCRSLSQLPKSARIWFYLAPPSRPVRCQCRVFRTDQTQSLLP